MSGWGLLIGHKTNTAFTRYAYGVTNQRGVREELVAVRGCHIERTLCLLVARLDGDQFVEDHRTDVPVLRHARGSSHGTRVVGRPNVRWFLVHFVSYESPRRYYHAVVETDDGAHTVHRLTYPFTFEGEPIEYAGSLAVDETHLTVYYSVKDAASRYLRVPRDRLTWTLPP